MSSGRKINIKQQKHLENVSFAEIYIIGSIWPSLTVAVAIEAKHSLRRCDRLRCEKCTHSLPLPHVSLISLNMICHSFNLL